MNEITIYPQSSYGSPEAAYSNLEYQLLTFGMPERALDKPIQNLSATELKQVYPLVVTSQSKLASLPVANLDIISLYGCFAEIDFEMVSNPDPRVVIPLFVTNRLCELYFSLIRNLQNWSPNMSSRFLTDYSTEMNYQLDQIIIELGSYVPDNQMKWFWQKMTMIVNKPLDWYQSSGASPQQSIAIRNMLNRGRRSSSRSRSISVKQKARPKHLLDLEDQVRRGEIHYTEYQKQHDQWLHGE